MKTISKKDLMNKYGIDLQQGVYYIGVNKVSQGYEIYKILDDTCGCILVGDNQVVGGLVNSTIHFNRLMQRLIDAKKIKEPITIEII